MSPAFQEDTNPSSYAAQIAYISTNTYKLLNHWCLFFILLFCPGYQTEISWVQVFLPQNGSLIDPELTERTTGVWGTVHICSPHKNPAATAARSQMKSLPRQLWEDPMSALKWAINQSREAAHHRLTCETNFFPADKATDLLLAFVGCLVAIRRSLCSFSNRSFETIRKMPSKTQNDTLSFI